MRSMLRWCAKAFGVAVIVTAALMLVQSEKDGVHTAGEAVDYTGTATGATIGYIPRFFDALAEGQAITAKDGAAADKSSNN